ncbi:MAG: diaminopimelate epimerase [candidate division WS1 bacterium]|jgi:diaminopimelate epimerase|nr:diaminopimelate epimerase [candidate division WS1 bacterium]
MQFTKMHGLGNDYIYINAIEQDLAGYDLARLATVLSDRHFGIGGDGIILVAPSQAHDFTMRIFNSDGSEAEMCGNGVRAFARYVYEHGLTDKLQLEIETGAGVIKPSLLLRAGIVEQVTVDMGQPRLHRGQIPMSGEPADEPVIAQQLEVGGRSFEVTCVSMGNPHCVIFTEQITDELVLEWGPKIEHHPAFPRRTNVEFARLMGTQCIEMRVWERGAGETLACGTGACAVTVASILNRHCQEAETVHVHLLGGRLDIQWQQGHSVLMTGPADEVFSGTVHPSLLDKARV